MEKQTRFSLHACLRAVGYTGLIVGILVLLYQVVIYLELGTWNRVGIVDIINGLGWDEIYWLPSATDRPTLHKLMSLIVKFPIWVVGIALWVVIRLFVGSPRKDEVV